MRVSLFFLRDAFVGKTTVCVYTYIYIYIYVCVCVCVCVPRRHNLELFLVIQVNTGQLECHKRLKLYTHKERATVIIFDRFHTIIISGQCQEGNRGKARR
jgi:hypothetical protein